MQQEDYLKRQIDQLGQVLGKILASLAGTGTSGMMPCMMEASDHALKEELGMGVSDFTLMPAGKLIEAIREVKSLNAENLDKLADIFFLLAGQAGPGSPDYPGKQELSRMALAVYEHLDKTSSTYSFDRHLRIEKLKGAR
ncbi:MAG: hypothetical protein NT040_09875 [Bacteroidetes bacterium]|nr:hypothetical protein [Bacteroidota bacterium]